MGRRSIHTSTFCPILFRHVCCYKPPTVQRAWVALRSSAHTVSWNGRMRGSVLAFASQREHSSAEERAYQDKASEVDAQSPPGLCIAAGPNPMEGRECKDAQCQHMQPSPPGVANARAQPGADADG